MRGTRASSGTWCGGRAGAGMAALALVAAAAACSDTGPGTPDAPPPSTPAPAFFIGDQFTATQRATRAVVDAGTVWLLDANGDFVFGADPATNWNAQTGLALTWKQFPGAANYAVMARNTVTYPTTWQELLVVAAPDAQLDPMVVATGVNPWSFGLGTGGYPWSFGNHVQFAIQAEDDKKLPLENGLSDVLETADDFAGVLTSIEIDHAGLPVPFDPRIERGATFDKTIRLSFSEPMSTAAPPTLTSQSANLIIRRVNASAWGSDPDVPSAAPTSAASHAFLELELTVKGACTELLVARWRGDFILEVRDTSFFIKGASSRLLFLDGTTGEFLSETTGVDAVDESLGRLTLGTSLVSDLPPGALVCALSSLIPWLQPSVGGATVPQLQLDPSPVGTVVVTDATPFFVGERVAVYDPLFDGTGQNPDLPVVMGVDTDAKVLLLSEPLTPGQKKGSFVLPLNGLDDLGGEVALRPSAALDLQKDVGPLDAELFVAAPTTVMVGDTVLVDADGRLDTTFDQAQATVKQVKFAPASGTTSYSIVLELPTGLTLLHGRAKVIGMGDSILVGGTRDTSASAATPLDPHRDQFSPDGLLY